MTNRIIAAVARNGVIGLGSGLCWRLKDDLRLFRELTVGRTVVMGRKTFESLGCRPLPDRENVVLSSHYLGHHDVHCIHTVDELHELLKGGNVDVIGGAEIYALGFDSNLVDESIISHVGVSVGSINGAHVTQFPLHKMQDFAPAEVLHTQSANAYNEFDFVTVRYVRSK